MGAITATVALPRTIHDEIVTHAMEGWPDEVCGIVAGVPGGGPERLYRVPNGDPNPRIRYDMDPEAQFRTLMKIEEGGRELWGIYHSHPASPAYPSPTDRGIAYIQDLADPSRRIAAWPGAVYLICSLEARERPHVRAFRINPDDVEELDLRLT